MPSIYNHENACWGIKRTSCDMFHNVFKEEFQRNKLRENTSASDKLNETPNNTYVQYSVSSNGYYGYQPHKVIQEGSNTNEVEMEVEDIGETAGVSQNNDNTSRLGCVSFNVDLQNHLGRRKRQMTNDSTMDGSKRIRQEEAEDEMESPIQESHHKEYFSHHKCLMAHFV